MILLGIAVGYNIDHNFLKLYTAKMGQVPIRYCIFIIILFIDYLLFEEIITLLYLDINRCQIL